MAAAFVIWFAGIGSTHTSSSKEVMPSEPGHSTGHQRATRPRCVSAKRAVAFYRARVNFWRNRMGHPSLDVPAALQQGCPRYFAHVLQRKSAQARNAYLRWSYHWEWQKWLPDKWARIGACETGYGRRPGNWRWNSGTYQGAFGFYYGTWDQYKPRGAPSEAYLATPRQQYQCALNVAAVHGYGAWGCGGA